MSECAFDLAGLRSFILDQVKNDIFVRMAVLSLLHEGRGH